MSEMTASQSASKTTNYEISCSAAVVTMSQAPADFSLGMISASWFLEIAARTATQSELLNGDTVGVLIDGRQFITDSRFSCATFMSIITRFLASSTA